VRIGSGKKGIYALLLNPVLLGGFTWWLDRFGFNKRPAVTTARPNPGNPAGQPGTRANPNETRFFFSNMGLKIH